MKDILTFFVLFGFGIILFFVLFGRSIAAFVNELVNNRHRRLVTQAKYRRDVEIMAERRRIAEASGDAIKLLMVDEQLVRDFDRRLRVAIEAQKVSPEVEMNEEVTEVERDAKGRFLPRRTRT